MCILPVILEEVVSLLGVLVVVFSLLGVPVVVVSLMVVLVVALYKISMQVILQDS